MAMCGDGGRRRSSIGVLAWLAPMGLLSIVAVMVAVSMSGELRGGALLRFDAALLLALRTPGDLARPIGPAWLTQVFIAITALGGATLRWLLGGIGVCFLLAIRRRGEAAWLAASLTGAALIGLVLKEAFDRPRPQIAPHLTAAGGSGFPSGHALAAAALYLTLGAIIASSQPRLAVRATVLGLAVLLVVLIGVSRVYLGVHWPSDVLAGWMVGAAWALTVFAARRRMIGR